MSKKILYLLLFVVILSLFLAFDGLIFAVYWDLFLYPIVLVRIKFIPAIAFAALIRYFMGNYQPRHDEIKFDKAFEYLVEKPVLMLVLAIILIQLAKIL